MVAQTVAEPIPRRDEVMQGLFADLQIARFNELYYRRRANTTKHLITFANIIAPLAASAALAGILENGPGIGAVALRIVMGVAAITAAVAPGLGLEAKYAQFEKAALGHEIVRTRLGSLLRDLKLSELGDDHEARAKEIDMFRESLLALDEAPHESVSRSCWEQVEREFPADKAWTII